MTAVRRVAVVGAGAAGCFFTHELVRRIPQVRVDLYDREGRGPGAGIVLAWEFAERLRAAHPRALDLPAADTARWDRTRTLVGDQVIWSGAYGTSGFRRRAFHAHLRALTAGLPQVELRLLEVERTPQDADLVVLADGAGSRLREARREAFRPRTAEGATRYQWLSTPAVLEPSFVLRDTAAGPLVVHAYPHAADESTFIVEADPRVLDAAGMLNLPADETARLLADVFADELRGAPLTAHLPAWRPFRTLVTERWYDGSSVLVGDAAHTVHFSTGSGTSLAVGDALELARAVAEEDTVAAALKRYAATRQPLVARAQAEAGDSMLWFERACRRGRRNGHQTVFALRSRRDHNTFARLRERDPEFVARTVAQLAPPLPDGEPVDLPLVLGALALSGRLVRLTTDDRGRPAELRLPSAAAALRCPVVATAAEAAGSACALLRAGVVDGEAGGAAGSASLRLEREVAALRSGGALAVGLLFDGETRNASPSEADFLAVPLQEGAGRVTRTRLADDLRHAHRLPVLLLSDAPLDRDEANTLIAAGRIDLAVGSVG